MLALAKKQRKPSPSPSLVSAGVQATLKNGKFVPALKNGASTADEPDDEAAQLIVTEALSAAAAESASSAGGASAAAAPSQGAGEQSTSSAPGRASSAVPGDAVITKKHKKYGLKALEAAFSSKVGLNVACASLQLGGSKHLQQSVSLPQYVGAAITAAARYKVADVLEALEHIDPRAGNDEASRRDVIAACSSALGDSDAARDHMEA